MTNKVDDIIPLNTVGKPLDIEKSVLKHNVSEAIETYHTAYCKLRRPAGWMNFTAAWGTEVTLEKAKHNNSKNLIELGDYIRIDMPGPGPHNGGGFDWVQAELLEENVFEDASASFVMRLRACANPQNNSNENISHFFKGSATSTFIIRRDETEVKAIYAGRNEVPNLKNTDLHDKLRNAAVSFAALAGFSKIQWTGFLQSLLTPKN